MLRRFWGVIVVKMLFSALKFSILLEPWIEWEATTSRHEHRLFWAFSLVFLCTDLHRFLHCSEDGRISKFVYHWFTTSAVASMGQALAISQ